MDHDLLIREDFYTEERLKHFCGAEKVHFHSCDKSSPEATLRCNLTGFSKIAPSFKANIRSGREFWQDAYEFIIDQRYKNGVLEYGLIQWHCHIKDPHLSFDKIEELMGSPKKITSLPIQAIRKGDVATHRLGHKGLEYLSKVSRNPGTIWLSLQSNGTLLMAGFKTNRETPPSPSV